MIKPMQIRIINEAAFAVFTVKCAARLLLPCTCPACCLQQFVALACRWRLLCRLQPPGGAPWMLMSGPCSLPHP